MPSGYLPKNRFCRNDIGGIVVRGNVNRNGIKHVNRHHRETHDNRRIHRKASVAELKEWSAQIDLVAAKTENGAAHVKFRYAEELVALRAKQHATAE